ncbi:MAG: hypothetical protein LBK01_01110 [Burkholderiaceae bacterium]|jgi:DNA-binding transcriptional regulator YiaG|nr:hypothetical protein [Burkholderiaceae bacterium]
MKHTKFDPTLLPSVTMVPPSNMESILKKGKSKRAAAKKASSVELSRDQQELVDIRKTLGLRHQDFAIMLNIGLPRLSSYTYGRTAKVPEEIMATARQLLAENADVSKQIRDKFARPMSEILTEWAKKLGTRTDTELASLLGVVSMTVSRWKKNGTRPDLSALNRYDHIVDLIANNAKVRR